MTSSSSTTVEVYKERVARLLLVIALFACSPRPRAERPGRPRLVVLLVIDQLPSWSFDERLPLLRHGLGKLLAEGVHFTQVLYPYAATFTATGHAALVTGGGPTETGIVANKW